jgi:hypothetical protein
LVGFVASVLTPDGDGYRVPAGWMHDLDGLAGFDRASGTVRLTGDAERLRDGAGRDLLYPGRSHPLTRRAIASVRTGRVSAARADRLSLVVSYTVEVGALLRKVFALRLFADGSIVQQPDLLALAEHEVSQDGAWNRWFAGWAPDALAAAGARAAMIADRVGSEFVSEHRGRMQRETAAAEAWLRRRSTELCGAVAPWSGDLFDAGSPDGDWRVCAEPEQRLSDFVADATVAAARRREAADVLARFRSATAKRMPIPPASARMLGMLMLVA